MPFYFSCNNCQPLLCCKGTGNLPLLDAPTWDQVSRLIESLAGFQWAIVALIIYLLMRKHIADIVSRVKTARLGGASLEMREKPFEDLKKGTEGATLSSGIVEVKADGIVVEDDARDAIADPEAPVGAPAMVNPNPILDEIDHRRPSYDMIARTIVKASSTSAVSAIRLLAAFIELELQLMMVRRLPKDLTLPARELRSIETMAAVLAASGVIKGDTLVNLVNFSAVRNIVQQNSDEIPAIQMIGAISSGLNLLKSIMPSDKVAA